MIDFTLPQIHLNQLTATEFLNQYWQKKPLLIRGAFPEFQDPDYCPLSPDELAGLAIEEGIISRLITGTHDSDDWNIEYGPFKPERFSELPESGWSLLVSDVEKHLPEFADYVEYFRFIPDWRIDDLMISYAPKGGSVGKHTDEYDVFLLQGHGQRRWQIEDERSTSELIEGVDIKLLKQFTATQDWVLEPGDMLYLPPGIAHYGVALSDCMTWSFGFRSPSWQSLIEEYAIKTSEHLSEAQRYEDPNLVLQTNPAQITPSALHTVKEQLHQLLQMPEDDFATWFGKALSQQSCTFELPEQSITHDELCDDLNNGRALMLYPYVRLAYTEHEHGYHVYIDGHCTTLSHANQHILEPSLKTKRFEINADHLHEGHSKSPIQPEITHWLCDGFNQGHWVWEDELMQETLEDEFE